MDMVISLMGPPQNKLTTTTTLVTEQQVVQRQVAGLSVAVTTHDNLAAQLGAITVECELSVKLLRILLYPRLELTMRPRSSRW